MNSSQSILEKPINDNEKRIYKYNRKHTTTY